MHIPGSVFVETDEVAQTKPYTIPANQRQGALTLRICFRSTETMSGIACWNNLLLIEDYTFKYSYWMVSSCIPVKH